MRIRVRGIFNIPGVRAMRQAAKRGLHNGLVFLAVACLSLATAVAAEDQFFRCPKAPWNSSSECPLPVEMGSAGEIADDGAVSDSTCPCSLFSMTIGDPVPDLAVPWSPPGKVVPRSILPFRDPHLSEIFHPPRT